MPIPRNPLRPDASGTAPNAPAAPRTDPEFAGLIPALATDKLTWTLARSGVLRLAKLPAEEQRAYFECLLAGGKPCFPSAKSTITLSTEPRVVAAQLLRKLGRNEVAAVARLLTAALREGKRPKGSGGRSRRRAEV